MLELQLFVCLKSPLLAPVNAMLEMFSFLPPLLKSVTVWDALEVPTIWLLKDTDDGERLAGGVVPVPLSPTNCGLLAALSLTVKEAVSVPTRDGINVTLMVQLAPVARVDGLRGQVFVWPKSVRFVPVIATLETLNAWL